MTYKNLSLVYSIRRKKVEMKNIKTIQLKEWKKLSGECNCREDQGKPNLYARIVHGKGCYVTVTL